MVGIFKKAGKGAGADYYFNGVEPKPDLEPKACGTYDLVISAPMSISDAYTAGNAATKDRIEKVWHDATADSLSIINHKPN